MQNTPTDTKNSVNPIDYLEQFPALNAAIEKKTSSNEFTEAIKSLPEIENKYQHVFSMLSILLLTSPDNLFMDRINQLFTKILKSNSKMSADNIYSAAWSICLETLIISYSHIPANKQKTKLEPIKINQDYFTLLTMKYMKILTTQAKTLIPRQLLEIITSLNNDNITGLAGAAENLSSPQELYALKREDLDRLPPVDLEHSYLYITMCLILYGRISLINEIFSLEKPTIFYKNLNDLVNHTNLLLPKQQHLHRQLLSPLDQNNLIDSEPAPDANTQSAHVFFYYFHKIMIECAKHPDETMFSGLKIIMEHTATNNPQTIFPALTLLFKNRYDLPEATRKMYMINIRLAQLNWPEQQGLLDFMIFVFGENPLVPSKAPLDSGVLRTSSAAWQLHHALACVDKIKAMQPAFGNPPYNLNKTEPRGTASLDNIQSIPALLWHPILLTLTIKAITTFPQRTNAALDLTSHIENEMQRHFKPENQQIFITYLNQFINYTNKLLHENEIYFRNQPPNASESINSEPTRSALDTSTQDANAFFDYLREILIECAKQPDEKMISGLKIIIEHTATKNSDSLFPALTFLFKNIYNLPEPTRKMYMINIHLAQLNWPKQQGLFDFMTFGFAENALSLSQETQSIPVVVRQLYFALIGTDKKNDVQYACGEPPHGSQKIVSCEDIRPIPALFWHPTLATLTIEAIVSFPQQTNTTHDLPTYARNQIYAHFRPEDPTIFYKFLKQLLNDTNKLLHENETTSCDQSTTPLNRSQPADSTPTSTRLAANSQIIIDFFDYFHKTLTQWAKYADEKMFTGLKLIISHTITKNPYELLPSLTYLFKNIHGLPEHIRKMYIINICLTQSYWPRQPGLLDFMTFGYADCIPRATSVNLDGEYVTISDLIQKLYDALIITTPKPCAPTLFKQASPEITRTHIHTIPYLFWHRHLARPTLKAIIDFPQRKDKSHSLEAHVHNEICELIKQTMEQLIKKSRSGCSIFSFPKNKQPNTLLALYIYAKNGKTIWKKFKFTGKNTRTIFETLLGSNIFNQHQLLSLNELSPASERKFQIAAIQGWVECRESSSHLRIIEHCMIECKKRNNEGGSWPAIFSPRLSRTNRNQESAQTNLRPGHRD